MKRLVAVMASAAALVSSMGTAAAYSDPYSGLGAGYDAASGQCGAAAPAGTGFAILNVTGGRPFTLNSCLASEVAAAGARQVTFYFNTGYAGAYGRDITSDCTSVNGGRTGKAAQAYQIGCSEASFALAHAPAASSAWWLDVETANSWSSASTAYNAATIQGAVDRIHKAGVAAGVYSTPGSWNAIVGSSGVTGVDASWAYSGNGYACGQTAFAGAPIWVLQGAAVGGFDTDTAC